MYCHHCGYHLNEKKVELKKSSFSLMENFDSEATVSYICPRCGHLIHGQLNEEEYKALSRASHAQIQRGSNNFAFGMSFNAIGLIALAISVIFYFLSIKPSVGHLVTTCAEFYVFLVLLVLSVILLSAGIYFTIVGIVKKKHYNKLLKDLNNKTFVQ